MLCYASLTQTCFRVFWLSPKSFTMCR